MNQAQTESGRRIRLMPLQRMSSVVEMKFSEPSNWPTQKMAMETAHNTCPFPAPDRRLHPTRSAGA